MLKRVISALLVLTLVCAQLPALGESPADAALTSQEIAQARALIATEPGAAIWQEGDALSEGMNALQVQQYLEWLLTQNLDGLMLSIQDAGQLLGERQNYLDGVENVVQQLRNQVSYYAQLLESGRSAVMNDLYALENDPELTDRERWRIALNVREQVSQMQAAIRRVALAYQQYEALFANHRLAFQSTLSAVDSPEGVITGPALEALSAQAAQLTQLEQAQIDQQNADFSVLVLSTKEFGLILRDEKGNPVKGASVKVSAYDDPTQVQTVKTGEDGLAAFQIKDFLPDGNNRVTVNVVITRDFYCTREMRQLRIRGGQGISLRMSPYLGLPYLRMACFNGSDILSQQNTIYYTPKNDEYHYFSVLVEKQGKGQRINGTITLLYQSLDEDEKLVDNEVKRNFYSGTAVNFSGPWCQRIAPGTTVSFRVQCDNFDQIFTTQLNIQKAVVEEPLLDANKMFSLIPGDFSFQIPSEIPFIGGSRMSLGVPTMKASLLVDPSGFIQLAYGKSFASEAASWKSENEWDKLLRLDDADKQAQRDANAIENQVYQDAGATAKSKFLGQAKAAVTLFAALQGRIREGDQKMALKGQAGVQAAFQSGFSYPFMAFGTIPSFVGMDFRFALGVAFALGLEASWPDMNNLKLDYGSGVTLNILAELGASVGVGIKSLATLAVRFFGNVSPTLRLGKTSAASVTIAFGVQVVAQLLLLKWTQDLYRGTYTQTTNGAAQNTADAAGTQDSPGQTLSGLAPGVNTPDRRPLSAADGALPGLSADEETQLFSRVDSLAQPVQYVTLQSDSEKATFAFWITPVSGEGAHQAELIWFNLDDPAKTGTVGSLSDSFRLRQASDYAFAVMAHHDLVGVNVLSGAFEDGSDYPSESRMTGCVLRLENGSLTQEYTRVEAPAQSKGKAAYMNSPLLHLTDNTQPASPGRLWYFNFSCALNDYTTGRALSVYSMEVNRTLQNYQPVSVPGKARVDVLSPRSGAQRFAAASPYASATQGEESISCYYYLSGNGELYARTNGAEKHLDGYDSGGEIIFMAPLVDYFVNDGNAYLFYLQKGQSDDGADCFRLKGIQRSLNGTVFSIRDYDICLAAESFQLVTVDDGSLYGIPYLYWTESLAPNADDPNQETHYRVRAVRFDRSSNTLSAPFTLTELSHFPTSLQIVMALNGEGACQGFYTTDMERPADSSGATLSQRLIGFAFTLKTAVTLRGAAAYDPCVSAGDYAKLLFSVENTGNLPVSRFAVNISKDGQLLESVLVDCTEPQSSVNGFMGDAADSAFSVFRVGSVFDQLGGDDFLMVTADDSGSQTYQRVQTELFMPGAVRTYQAVIQIPDDWEGSMVLSADVATIYALSHYTGAFYSAGAADAARPAADAAWQGYEVALPAADARTNGAETVPTHTRLRVARANLDKNETQKEIGVGKGDLMLDCQPYADGDGNQYVQVSIIGRSQTDSRIQPTLTVTRDGQTVLRHTFARAIDADFGYTLDLPAALLLGGAEAGELVFTITDNDEGNEFAFFDNERTVSLGTPLRILQQPESVSRLPGEGASFSVAAAGGQMPYSYQWQRRNPGGEWENLPGANQAVYTISAVSAADAGALLRCRVQDQRGSEVVSDPAVISLLSRPPETGDAARPALWALLMLSGVCLLLSARKRRRE